MKLIILPGNSAANRAWGEAAVEATQNLYPDFYAHRYHHWESGEPVIDFNLELEKLSAIIPTEEPCVFLAKSAGTVLVLRGLHRGLFKPAKSLFVGFPLSALPEHQMELAALLPELKTPLAIIQNTNDPIASFACVKNFAAKLNLPNLTLIETPGDNHDYLDFDLIKTKVPDFFKNNL